MVAWAAFVGLKNVSIDLASAVSGVLGSLTNTVGVLGMAVLLGYLPLAAVVPIVPQALVEAVLAAVVTVVVVRGSCSSAADGPRPRRRTPVKSDATRRTFAAP